MIELKVKANPWHVGSPSQDASGISSVFRIGFSCLLRLQKIQQ